ncbi:efflux transporter outer membrane subunit [uncultured Parasutterella sp.]|uniref:efflux transporter outer membrane subunit n=1 Tax=uncultured Parasutterella sp. TaxID=1263098 RepID=UPI0025B5B148|nr:efflux transporter outer membrane subunit [uncultured Parasutterella sp.]
MKSTASILATAVVLTTLTGCVTTPDFQMTEEQKNVIPQRWLGPSVQCQESINNLAEWWATWSDPEIALLVEKSQSANTDIRVARENLRQADAAMTIANAGMFPQADGEFRGGRSHFGGTGSNSFQIGLNLSLTLDAGGRYAAAQAAFSDYLYSKASLGQVQTAIAARVAQAYISLRLAQRRVSVAEQNLKTQQEAYDLANWRYKAGLVSSTDVDQAITSLEQTKASIPVYAAQVHQYRNLLAVLTSSRPDEVGQHQVKEIPQPPKNLALSIPGEVLRNRPDVRASEAQVMSAMARVTQARSALFPSLTISGSFGFSASTFGALGDAGIQSSSGFGTLNIPIFHAGSLLAQLEQRNSQLESARINYEASLLKGVQEVEDALNTIWAQQLREKSLREAERSARSAAISAQQDYNAGLQDFTVVLTTQRTLLTVQEALASVEAEISNGYVALYKAVGGGWPVPQEFKENDK